MYSVARGVECLLCLLGNEFTPRAAEHDSLIRFAVRKDTRATCATVLLPVCEHSESSSVGCTALYGLVLRFPAPILLY